MTTASKYLPRFSGWTFAAMAGAAVWIALNHGTDMGNVPSSASALLHDVTMTMSAGTGTGADTGTANHSVARPATISKVLSCERLSHVPGKSITTVLVDFPPGAYSPAHRHPGSVTAYVTKGIIRSQLDGGVIGTFAQGDTFFETRGTLHNFAENPSRIEPAQLLATFVADNDCGPLTIPER